MNKFLIDGFPRALDQSDAFESSVCKSAAMLFLDCPEEVMEVRCTPRDRLLHSGSNAHVNEAKRMPQLPLASSLSMIIDCKLLCGADHSTQSPAHCATDNPLHLRCSNACWAAQRGAQMTTQRQCASGSRCTRSRQCP